MSYGIDLVNDEAGHTEAFDVDVVVQGFDTELVYEKLDKAVHFLRRGAKFIAANPDWVCPMPAGEVLPDCGSICALLTASSGVKPEYIGKPNRNMIDVIAKMTGIENGRICAVGDRLYTDIAVAQNAGSVSVLVMSGETDEQILAAAERKPRLYVSCGTKDFLYGSHQEFVPALKENGWDVTSYDEPDAVHEWGFWDREIRKFIDFIYEG
jgi:ribonucleotide monophosphatase NagD (HAD superfamily)